MGILDNAQAQQIQVTQAPVTTGQSTSYDPTVVDQENMPQANANGWTATNANATTYDAATHNANGGGYVQERMNSLLDENSDYIQLNRNQALQSMNGRGLLNSSMAAGAGQMAAIQSALPIAQQDAQTFNQVGMFNVGQTNAASADNAAAKNQIELSNQAAQNNAASDFANAQNQTEQFNANTQQQQNLANQQAQNQASQFGAQAANDFAARNMDAINRSAADFAAATNAASMQNVENQMRILLAGVEEQLSTYATDMQRKTALDGIASTLIQSGVNAGVFATVEGGANWLKMIGDVYPDMGLSVSDSLAETVSGGVQ